MRYVIIGIWAVFVCTVSAGAEATEYVCLRAGGPITMDGALDEPSWQSAGAIDGFLTLGPRGEPVKNATRIRVLFDDKSLYLGGDCATQPGAMPNTIPGPSERDKNVWGNDCVDMFFQPREGEPAVFQFMVAAQGNFYDARYLPADPKGETWTSHAEVKTRQRIGGWSFEIAIPFSDFERKPFRGDVWVFRIGVVAKGFEYAMWPHNPELHFNNKACRAYLIFEDRNLIANGDFETPPPAGEKALQGWRFIVNTDLKAEGQGDIRIVTMPDAPAGPRVIELQKTDEVGYFPALVFDNMPVEPGATYDFTVWIKAEKSFYTGMNFAGPEVKDPAQRFYVRGEREYPASPAFQKITARYRADDRVVLASSIVRYQKHPGRLWVDGMSFQRVNGLALSGEKPKPADPIHNLVELSVRAPFKPFWLLKQPDGRYRNEPTIFKDTGTGATIWKMSRHPGYLCRHQYMQFSPWNCNGERLLLTSLPEWWKIEMKSDGSAWRPMERFSSYMWDRFDPNIVWRSDGSERRVLKYNISTGESMVAKEFKGYAGIWPLSHDGKYLLTLDTFPADGKQTSLIYLIPTDMKRSGEGVITVDPGQQVHQLWFTGRPDYSMAFGYEDYMKGGAIMTPDGKVLKYVTDGRIPGGHEAPSPTGKWAVNANGYVYDCITGKSVWITDHSMGHQSWGPDDTWFIGSAGFDLRRFGVPPKHFDQLLCSANSKMKYSIYWAEEHPAGSPDGTKFMYASNMLGHIDCYVLIARLPEAPVGLKAEEVAQGVRLRWQPPAHGKEIALYRIHRSDSMAGPYRPVATAPVGQPSYEWAGDKDGYFVVTSREYCGLEGGYSDPVAAGRPRGPFVARAEAEDGAYEAPGEELFDSAASNLYAVALGISAPCKGLKLKISLPRETIGRVYSRVRNIVPDAEPKLSASFGGAVTEAVPVKEKSWQWIPLSARDYSFKPPFAEVELIPSEAGIVVDQVVIADDPNAVPKLFWGRDFIAPGPLTGLVADAADSYRVRLSWKAPAKDSDVAYYNVYAARGDTCTPGNETLIASPAATDMLDWGLMAGTKYAYCVTAVDRAGNESAPSETRTVMTPPVKDRLFIRQPCSVRTDGAAALEIPLKLDAPGEALVWVKMRCFNQANVVRFKVLLDGQPLREPYQFPTYFITPHHPGPATDVWFWSCIANTFQTSEEGKRPLMGIPAGQHVLSLVPDTEFNSRYGKIDVEFGETIVTNDLGYVPPGITNYLIDPARGRR